MIKSITLAKNFTDKELKMYGIPCAHCGKLFIKQIDTHIYCKPGCRVMACRKKATAELKAFRAAQKENKLEAAQ